MGVLVCSEKRGRNRAEAVESPATAENPDKNSRVSKIGVCLVSGC